MVNKVILVGNLGRDPELRYTPSGTPVCKFSIATSEKFKDRNGEQKEETVWHNITTWAKLAEICGQYLTKGKTVYIEGKIKPEEWEKDGVKQRSWGIVASVMRMIGGAKSQNNSQGGGGWDDPPAGGVPDDDIPF